MKKRLLVGALVAVGCSKSPPPQYPPPAAPPQPMPEAAAQAEQAEPGTPPVAPAGDQPAMPPAAASDDTPIDPMAEMPEENLGTDATLELGKPAKVTIDARADIFSATLKEPHTERGGKLPSAITLATGGTVITFPKVVGKVGCSGDAAYIADGGACAGGNTNLTSTKNLAGVIANDRTLFLVGVFTGPKLPAKAPTRLDFSPKKLGVAFAKLEPQLGQVFFIGDGKTGTASGDLQKFVIPKGATMLYIGYADGYGFQGVPGWYADNKGGLGVTVTQEKE